MITRLRIQGFKNLVDIEIRFGPLTCIAGPNGVGKSNLFDAINFLSLLADKPFVEAVGEVRGGDEVDSLFTIGGNGKIHIECDVLIPTKGKDDFNQPAEASASFLTYTLDLRLDLGDSLISMNRIRLEKEELTYVTKGDSQKRIGFPYSTKWFDSVAPTIKRTRTFITTQPRKGLESPIVRLQSDRMQDPAKSKRGGGKPTEYAADLLPRTVLSSAQNAEETRTAVLLRQEMRQWRQLQLEPSALRRPDAFHDPQTLDTHGGHIPGTLFRLAASEKDSEKAYSKVANRLAQLVEGVSSVHVDRDIGRKLLKFMMSDSGGLELPASALSDGTLRFVALAVLEQDPDSTGVLCLEEPENGINPERVEAMLWLLRDLCVDSGLPVGNDNPLRQVITSTHSPVVVGHAVPDEVLFACPRKHRIEEKTLQGVEFIGLNGSWRVRRSTRGLSEGAVLSFLGSIVPVGEARGKGHHESPAIGSALGDQLVFPFSASDS